MFGIKSKKDKQAELDREIESVLCTMRQICPADEEDYVTDLDAEIQSVLEAMDRCSPDTDEYTKMVSNLVKLYEAKTKEKNRMTMYMELSESLERLYKLREKKESKVPWKEITMGSFALVQIIAIIKHEELNIITGKAIGFVSKGRV